MIKVVCYNLDQRLYSPSLAESIAQVLEVFHADVIFLQEVMIWQEVELLAKRLKMYCNKNAWTAGGYTVISKKMPSEYWSCTVPASNWGAGAAGAKIGNVWYLSLHLDDQKYKRDETQRFKETEYILSKIPNGKIILAGDFNSPSHLDRKKNVFIYPSTLFTDWLDVQAGKSWTRGTWMPSRSQEIDRIDRIYARGVTPIRGGIVDHHDLGLTRWPTGFDHRLIWQNFK